MRWRFDTALADSCLFMPRLTLLIIIAQEISLMSLRLRQTPT